MCAVLEPALPLVLFDTATNKTGTIGLTYPRRKSMRALAWDLLCGQGFAQWEIDWWGVDCPATNAFSAVALAQAIRPQARRNSPVDCQDALCQVAKFVRCLTN
jgi:hypothetical protein